MENSSRLDEVDLAWDNLQEAKSVLQQIENKLNFEEVDLLPDLGIRKRLQSEPFGCDEKDTSSISKQGGSLQRLTSLRSYGLDKHVALGPKWTPSLSRTNDSGSFNCILENCHSSRRIFWNERTNPLYNDMIDQDIPLSAVKQTTVTINQDLNGNPSTGPIPTRLHALGDMDMMENDWFIARKQEACSGLPQSNACHLKGSPPVGDGSSIKRCILQEKKQSPKATIGASIHSPPGNPLARQLELPRSKSPASKLERLKERIRKQRKLQKEQHLEGTSSNQPQELPIPVLRQKIGDPFKNGSIKCLVRKVTFAPPAPAYKGFNVVELTSDKKSSVGLEEMEEALTVNSRTSRRELMRRRDWGLQEAEQRRNSPKSSSRNHEATNKARSPSKSPSPKRATDVERPRSSGIFAWREGQKLVKMLLGPPPKLPNFLAKAQDPDDRNGCVPSDQQVKDPVEHEQSTSFEKTARRRLCIANEGHHCCTSVKTGLLDSGQNGLEAVQVTGILHGLQSEKNVGKNQNSTWKVGNGSPSLESERSEDSQRGLVNPKENNDLLSHKGKQGSSSPGCTSSLKNSNLRSGSRTGSKRSPSPSKRTACSSSPFLKNPGAENWEEGVAGIEERLQSPLARSYNADEVREYMNRQLVERKMKERDEKRSVKQAMEMRKKRLQEVYRKQKEAVLKKTRGKQRGNSPAGCEEAAKQENRVGAAQAIKDRAAAQGNTEPGDSEGSGSCQWELNYAKGPVHHYLPANSSPLRLKDLELNHRSPEWSSSPTSLSPPIGQLLPLPLASCEREMSCKAILNRGVGYRSKQQRIEALRSMATTLSGRIENEAKRLGVEAEIRKSPGNQGCNEGWKLVDLGGFVRADRAAKLTDRHGQNCLQGPGTGLVTSPGVPSNFKILPTRLLKGEGQPEADAPKGKGVDGKTGLDVEQLMDELLCSSSSQSENFLWSDSEPLTKHGPHSKPREPDEQKELVNNSADVQRSFSKVDHQAARKGRTNELPLEAAQRENRSLSGRTFQEMTRVQDGIKSSLAQKSKKVGSHWSPSRTNSASSSGVKQTEKMKEFGYPPGIRRCQPITSDSLETRNGASLTGKSHWKKRQSHDPQRLRSGIAEHNYNRVSAQCPRSSGLSSAQNGRPSDKSRPSTSTKNIKELEKGKDDPVTQRLAELMKQLQEETEQLSFHCRPHSSLKVDSSVELKRSSTISPVITETTNYPSSNTRRRASVEISLDGRESVLGTTHTSLTDGSLVKDKLVEQSFWSLLPSESHWRQTVESNKKLQSGDNIVQNITENPFRKWQEAGTSMFGSPDAFSRFTLEMARQYLKEEELRARHQTALFRLREEALREKTKAELTWLEHQKTHLRDKGQDDKMPAIVQKQQEILIKLQQEKAEIRQLQNVYRAAHQERKLLLKQQQEIFRIHQSTTHLQCQLDGSAMDPQVSETKYSSPDAAPVNQSGHSASPDLSPRLPDQDEWSCSSLSASGSEGSIAMEQLKKMHNRLDERFLTKKEKELIRRRRQAEDLLEWKQRLDAEELTVRRIESEAVAAWSLPGQEKELGTGDPLTETDNWSNEKCSSSPESNKPLGSDEVVTSAADVPLDEQSQGHPNVETPAESLEQMATIVLKPSEKSATEGAEKGLLITGMAPEPAVGENCSSPLRRELANRNAMIGNRWSEQKRRQREKLKMEEAELCRQLEEYDAFISKTRAELISDTDFNLILKPQIKTPAVVQHKPQTVFPWLQRSNILKHLAKPTAEILQPQDFPSKRGEKAKDMEQLSKPQEITGSVDVSHPPGKSEIAGQQSHSPVSQLPPSSGPVDRNQSAENQSETLTPCGSPESSGSSDIVIESSSSSSCCKEEILQNNKSDYSTCSRAKSNGSSDDTLSEKPSIVLEAKGNVLISPSKPTESLFGRKSQLPLSNGWNDFATKATDTFSQTSAHHLLNSNTNPEAEESIELENIQPNNTVKNSEDTEQNWFGLLHHSETISGFRTSSNHQPPLELAQNEILQPEREADCREMRAAKSTLGEDDHSCESTATPSSLRSSLLLNKSVALAHGHLTSASISRTAEVISPKIPLSYMDDFSSTEENSEDQDQDSLCNEAVQPPAVDILCAKENLSSSLEQANPLMEEMALCRADQSPVAEGIASKSDELPSLNDKQKSGGSQTLSPVLKEFLCKEKDLVSVKGIGSLAQEEQPSLVEEISTISKEFLSSVEEDNMFNIKELSCPVDELMLYESEAFPLLTEADISFETEDFPPPPEEIILCMNKEHTSSIGESTFIRIEDLPLLSVDNSSINEALPSLGGKHTLLNIVDFTLLPLPIEEISEKRKNAAKEKRKHSLRTSGEEEASMQFGEEDVPLSESSRIHKLQAEQQMADLLRDFNIGDKVLVSHRDPDTLMFKGHTSFGQGYWTGVELDKPKGDHDGKICGVKYFECTNKYGIFVTPNEISHLPADYEVDTDVTNSEDFISDGAPGQNDKDLDDELKEAHSFGEAPEEKANEKPDTSQLRGKKPTSCQLNQREAHPGSIDEPELEQIILECAKAVESFTGSQDLMEAEVEPKVHLDIWANFEGLDHPWALQHPQGKDSEQFVNEVTEHLTEHLVEEALDKLTNIREQQNQSSKEMRRKGLDRHRITQDCSKLAQQNRSPLKGQRGHDKPFIDVIDLLRMDCIQLKDQIRIAKGGCSKKAIENVTENLITKFIDDAAKEYTKIKRKQNGTLDANSILCSQTTVDCLTQLDEVFNVGIFGSNQDANSEEFKALQPLQGSKVQGQRFALDHWCSGPWRQSKEAVFVVPYNLVDIQQLVDGAVNVLWNQCGQFQGGDKISVFEARGNTNGKDGDGENKGVHRQAIFDMTSDIFQNLLMKEPTAKRYLWLKHNPWVGLSPGHVPDIEDKSEVKSFIQGKVAKLLNLDRNDLEMRRNLQKLTKYGKSKRDRVDIILIQELQEEESQWVEYADDELAVKMKLTEDIFNILLHDTVDVLNTVCDRRRAGRSLTASSTQQLEATYRLQN
ncbi:centrosome-associated protein 350-like isoform X4 [Heterodontus francisci]|uniref:centrosome-associated protein 350-like isoform X4 n=1 Tax=Heterodontus francisci TaxID=7792 RepID=UPI00355BDB0A